MNSESVHKAWRAAVILCMTAIGVVATGSPAEAKVNDEKTKTVRVDVRVITDDDQPLKSATVYACPADQPLANCTTSISSVTNSAGKATLDLLKTERYNITALVRDPNPSLVCPGLVLDGHELYLANNPFTGFAAEFPKHPTFVIDVPSSTNQCFPLPVVDDLGNEVPGRVSAFFCRTEGSGCASLPNAASDSAGNLLFNINSLDTTAIYRIQPFVINSGWPCPFILDDGGTFHGGTTIEVTGADLIAGNVTLTIHHPTAAECAPPLVVPVFDDLGNQVPGETGAFFCRVENDGCTTVPYSGHDSAGNLLFNINSLDTTAIYRIQPFVINSGWPCPFILDDGGTFHGGTTIEVTGADLIAGNVTLTIHHPTAAECA